MLGLFHKIHGVFPSCGHPQGTRNCIFCDSFSIPLNDGPAFSMPQENGNLYLPEAFSEKCFHSVDRRTEGASDVAGQDFVRIKRSVPDISVVHPAESLLFVCR